MPKLRSLIDPGGRLLARHLARLSDTLETLTARLREAVSAALGETVSGIVRDTVRAVLAEPPMLSSSPDRFVPSPHPVRPQWARPGDWDDEPWFDDPDTYPPEPDDVLSNRTAPTLHPSRLPRALALGVQTMLCGLRRRIGRFPILTAVAIGLLTAVATYWGGPWAAAAVGLAGTAFNLLSLAETVHTSADVLAVGGTS